MSNEELVSEGPYDVYTPVNADNGYDNDTEEEHVLEEKPLDWPESYFME